MNSALALTDPDSIELPDNIQTLSDKDPIRTFKVSKERIDSFFKKPSVEPDEIDQTCQRKTSVSQSLPIKDGKAIAFVPKKIYHPKTFSSLQKWEGYVLELHEEYFIARITDMSDEHDDEEIEVMLTEISEDDRGLICPGAIFYWHIGYETERGTVKRSSIIRFRRMPRWTESDIEKAKDFEKQMKNFLNIEVGNK